MSDYGFPIIDFPSNMGPLQRGHKHGEEFKTAIQEIYEIRKELLLKRNPSLKDLLKPLAKEQYELSLSAFEGASLELKGISESSGLALEDIVLINNYTDFRDILLGDEGCSTAYIKNENHSIAGQTWDMHSSAKNYMCLLQTEHELSLSIIGCIGMAGINRHGLFIGVNNLNTMAKKSGIIWPVLVRAVLEQSSFTEFEKTLTAHPVTSGHNYLLADVNQAKMIELLPHTQITTSEVFDEGHCLHTNHCLSPETKSFETQEHISKTTHVRLDLLEKHIKNISNSSDLTQLLQGHENEPLSLCSHYASSGAKDPSQTCGGLVSDLSGGHNYFWRGCKKYDDNFKEYAFTLKEGKFLREK
ncbi:MAG: C45 family autoproteolytic acyltransferase/hydrolase [Bacteriovoracaceae bacterium]